MFVQQGGSLTIAGNGTISGNTVAGGAGSGGGGNGSAFGSGIFAQGGGYSVTLAPGTGNQLLVGDVITDQTGSGGTGANAGAVGITVGAGGTVVFQGADTYSGGTTINANGVLNLGGGSATGSILGNVADSGFLVFDRTNTDSFGGIVSGTGTLQQIGTGTTTLTGVNTYTGDTDINAGTLALGAGGSIAGARSVQLNAAGTEFDISAAGNQTIGALYGVAGGTVNLGGNTLTTGNGVTSLFAGTAVGTGGLTVTGAGTTLVLTGANTYTGATTVNTGSTLQLGNGGATGSVFGNVADAGSLVFDHSNPFTYAGSASGTGGLTQAGAGALTLTGSNTYTGGTTINLGTSLIVGDGATSGAIVGNVADGGLLTFNRSDTVIFNGIIAGAGALTQAGGGQLILGGVNTYSGATDVNAGTLALGTGSSIAASSGVNVAAGATFSNLNGFSQTIGTLSGAAGSFLQLGSNQLTFGTPANETFAGVIEGGGNGNLQGLVKQGGGTETLTGANTYLNDTTINEGTLAIGPGGSIAPSSDVILHNAGTTLDMSAAGTPTLNALDGDAGTTVNLGAKTLTLTFLNGVNGSTYAGTIQGSGGLILAGTGTGHEFTLAGANTYTGGTTIDPGNLLALTTFTGKNPGSIVGNVTDNGGILFEAGVPRSFAGVISGTGTLETAGGVLTLTGANTYAGTTLVADGTLALAGSGGIAGSQQVVVESGDLDISQTTSGATVQALFGVPPIGTSPGSSVHLGSKTLTVNIASGTPSFEGVNGFYGVISDGGIGGGAGGSLVKTGAGTLVLGGANTYTGTTTVQAGTLALETFQPTPPPAALRNAAPASTGSIATSSGLALSGPTAVFDISKGGNQTIQDLTGVSGSTIQTGANTLAFGTANSTTFSGGFAGTGGLMKQGAGTITLNGDSSAFTGTTSINAGELLVGDAADPSAVLGGDVNVLAGGLLRGHGTIGGSVNNSAGTVTPGGSIGVLTVSGNYTQGSAGLLNIEVTPVVTAGVGYDQLQVSGMASLAGALGVQVDSGTYVVGSKYDIVHAGGGVSGTFATVAYNPLFAAYITPQVVYQNNDVLLELLPTPAPPVTPPPVIPPPPPPMAAAPAFSTGRGYAANAFVVNQSLFDAMSATLGATDQTGIGPDFADPERGTWVRAIGGFGSANGYDINEYGAVAGHGFAVSPNFTLGAAISGIHTHTGVSQNTVDGESLGFYGYGIYVAGRLRISATAGAGALNGRLERHLVPLPLVAKADTSGWFGGAAASVQYRLGGPRLFAIPYAKAMYLHMDMGSASENGAGTLNLRYGGERTDLTRLSAGVSVGTALPESFGTVIPYIRVGGAGTLGNTHVGNIETLGLLSANETAISAPTGAVTTGAGVNIVANGPWRFAAAWSGQYGSGTTVNSFDLEARYVW